MKLCKPADVNEIVYLLHLHEVAVWFVQGLCETTTMINPCFVAKKSWSKQYPLKLSDEEKRRIFRGFYRLQIWSNLFRRAADQDDSGFSWNIDLTANEVVSLFILTMPPWEIDEIGCVFFTLRNRLEADWEEIVGLNSLDEVPEDTPEEEEWSLM
jgi:hypothetical protein